MGSDGWVCCGIIVNSLVASFDRLVAVTVRIGVFRDYVPGVEKAGKVSETQESDVYDAIGGAYPSLDPNGDGRKQNSENR